MKKITIMCTERNFDMAGWFQEKADSACECLARLCEVINTRTDITPEARDEIRQSLAPAVSYATRLLGASTGEFNAVENDDRNLVLEHGRSGLDELREKYNVARSPEKTH
jgi:hypothetical protein